MGLGNSDSGYGVITRLLHWATALAVLSALPLGIWISEMEVSLASLKYFGIHKSIGFVVLCLTILRIVWHLVSPKPPALKHGGWQDRLSQAVHRGFYASLLLMPLTGWIASSATGIDTVIFNTWTLPRIAPVSEQIVTVGFAVHGALGILLAAMILAHIAGAVYGTVILKDRTIARMLRG